MLHAAGGGDRIPWREFESFAIDDELVSAFEDDGECVVSVDIHLVRIGRRSGELDGAKLRDARRQRGRRCPSAIGPRRRWHYRGTYESPLASSRLSRLRHRRLVASLYGGWGAHLIPGREDECGCRLDRKHAGLRMPAMPGNRLPRRKSDTSPGRVPPTQMTESGDCCVGGCVYCVYTVEVMRTAHRSEPKSGGPPVAMRLGPTKVLGACDHCRRPTMT